MTLAEIKKSIAVLSPEEQAELDVWWTELETSAQRKAAFESLRRDLVESYQDMEAGRDRPWTDQSAADIRSEARKRSS